MSAVGHLRSGAKAPSVIVDKSIPEVGIISHHFYILQNHYEYREEGATTALHRIYFIYTRFGTTASLTCHLNASVPCSFVTDPRGLKINLSARFSGNLYLTSPFLFSPFPSSNIPFRRVYTHTHAHQTHFRAIYTAFSYFRLNSPLSNSKEPLDNPDQTPSRRFSQEIPMSATASHRIEFGFVHRLSMRAPRKSNSVGVR